MPIEWKNAEQAELAKIKGVCLDIDDTLSTAGKLTAEAYSSLWALKNAGFAVVPITGRPAGWCDHFSRFWPVDAVVGENGAFTFFVQDGVRKRLETPAMIEHAEGRKKLKALADEINARFPHAKWASDQSYREYDLAIDICEDVPAWTKSDVQELLALCARLGAHAKLSSIHVNAWYGEYDKRMGFEHWLKSGAPGFVASSPTHRIPDWNEWLFIGDSPNDEPLFASFPATVGVANLKRYIDGLKHPPQWITEGNSGVGFSEMARALIASRSVS